MSGLRVALVYRKLKFMNIRTAVLIFSALLLTVFGTLSISLVKFSNMLNEDAQAIANAGEGIRVAKEIKTLLLLYHKREFIFKVQNNSSRPKSREIHKAEIKNLLEKAMRLSNNEYEYQALQNAKDKIDAYLDRQKQFEDQPVSFQLKYRLIGQYVEDATSAIDQVILINKAQMKELADSIKKENKKANQIALFLLGLGGLTIFGIVFCTLQFIALPLTAVAQTIAKYGAGDLTARVNAKGVIEAQTIGANFNSMAQKLEEKRQDHLQFIASIAHDLRNPLSSMSMASELLIEGGHNDNSIPKIMRRQVRYLDRLVSDLLDTTRIEAGQLELNPKEQDVRTLIEDSVELYRTGSEIHSVRIHCPDEALICRCDGGRISQVLNNLLSNAIKYSPNGGSIVVKAWRESDKICISVTDQGIGIDSQDLENIFRPFHRSKATKGTIPGIGLGLSASRRITEAHGGRLEVESVPNKGSTFRITLPAQLVAGKISRSHYALG